MKIFDNCLPIQRLRCNHVYYLPLSIPLLLKLILSGDSIFDRFTFFFTVLFFALFRREINLRSMYADKPTRARLTNARQRNATWQTWIIDFFIFCLFFFQIIRPMMSVEPQREIDEIPHGGNASRDAKNRMISRT